MGLPAPANRELRTGRSDGT